jgi:pimeloyl-ACP methyl ester carboxylesterase
MKLLQLSITSLLLFSIASCNKRLDSFLFNKLKTDAYKLDAYTGETSGPFDPNYTVDANKTLAFTLPMISDGKEYTIGAVYTGNINSIATDTVLFYLHGNKHNLDFYWSRQRLYSNLGGKHNYGVLSIDYPGYGVSTGVPTEQNMYDATRAALQWLKNKGVVQQRLVMMGFSLGTAPVCEIAGHSAEYPLAPSKIIIEAPFASSEVMVNSSSVINLPASYFVDLKIDNVEEIKKVTVPMFWIHGKKDSFLSINYHGQLVYNAYKGTYKDSLIAPEGEHETNPTTLGYAAYNAAILKFIRK